MDTLPILFLKDSSTKKRSNIIIYRLNAFSSQNLNLKRIHWEAKDNL